jgi:hypothetical protein
VPLSIVPQAVEDASGQNRVNAIFPVDLPQRNRMPGKREAVAGADGPAQGKHGPGAACRRLGKAVKPPRCGALLWPQGDEETACAARA